MIITGHISAYDGENLTIIAPLDSPYILDKQQITDCEIRLNDGRTISTDQRKKIYATLRDISDWTGYSPDECKAVMKYEYIASSGANYFSLSGCTMTVANEFLEFLIAFCLEHDIPTNDSLIERSPDIARYIYWCLINKKCCITQKKAQLHHVDAVGMGRDRKDIIHKGMRVMPLYWELHQEAHNLGQESFNTKYHVFGIKADENICKTYRIRGII